MAPIIPDQALPRRSESGMTTRAVNAAAGVILAAMQQDRRTPTGLAIALDSACLLDSPEHAAEVAKLQARVAELEAAAYGDAEVRLLNPVEQIRHLHACVAAQMARADTLDRLCREQRARADQAEERLAEYERPTAEDPIAYTLTDKAQESADRLTRLFAPTQALQEETDPAAGAAPGPAGRVAQLLDAIRTQRGEWTTRKVQQVYRAFDDTEPLRATARTDLRILHAMGHLVQHEDNGRRFYTLRTRSGAGQ